MTARKHFRMSRPRVKTNFAVGTTSLALSLLLLAAPGAGRADTLYAAGYNNGYIVKYDSSGVPTVFASVGQGFPDGLAFDSAGNLYSANSESNTIEKFDSSGV